MVKAILLACSVFASGMGVALATAQDASGIKESNLRGANLGLMNEHDPASELENFELLPGYEVNLFAAEPMLANPIHMVWDSRGRLWVACSWAYPQIKPGEAANDKIIILEDTDQDGVADKSTVFADGLYVPTGIELANGGCYVGLSPDVYFLKDTDGDDIADVKELALTGFGIEDNHHSISAWRRGPGGWIYFQEGIFLHTQVETQHGMVRNYNGGVYQFNPRTGDLRVFCTGTGGNPWGHVFDRWGQSFMVNNPRILYLSPATGAYQDQSRIPPLISTEKQCGGDLVSGTHLPDEIQGQLLTCRFKSRTVVRYELVENGAGYSARVLEPLISSKHPNFRPVDCKIGPDGAVYVADWYNSIINHAQHDFRDPRRDHEHGRIWRITYKGRPLAKVPELVGASVDSLVSQLDSPEAWIRHQARKELSERNPDAVVTAVERWVDSLDVEAPAYDHHLVEAMWACQNVERASQTIFNKILQCQTGQARAAAGRAIRYLHHQLSDPVGMIARLANDPFPRARMEAVLSSGYIPRAESLPAMLNVLNHDRDKFIDVALPSTLTALEPYYLPALQNDSLDFSDPQHRAYAAQRAGIGLDQLLSAILEADQPSSQDIDQVSRLFSAAPSPKLVRLLVKALTREGDASPATMVALLGELERVGKRGKIKAGRYISGLVGLLSDPNDEVAAAVASSLGAWKFIDAGEALVAVIADGSRSFKARSAAAKALGAMAQPQYLKALNALAAQESIDSRYLAVIGLVEADMERAKLVVAELMATDPGKADPVALVLSFTRKRRGDGRLASALAGVRIHPKVMEAVATFHRETGQLPRNLQRYFLERNPRSLSAQLLRENPDALVNDVDRWGDAARGEMIYRRSEVACMTCHGIGSVGPTIGPNLVAVGAAANTQYMVESILEPNAAIAEHYENTLFQLQDGAVRMGIIAFENEREVILQDSAQGGEEARLLTDDIIRRANLPSLMPAGLADQLKNRQEFLDLTKFLSLLGQPGAYANNERPYIREWQIAPAVGGRPPADEAAWMTAYSMVSGELPFADFDRGEVVFARGFVDMLTAGEVRLRINRLQGLQLSVDGRTVADPTATLSLGKGRRTLTFRIDPAQRGKSGLRVETQAL